ncbi:sterol desaturase family protein [Amycolatopsis echigonensis]|uniref:Sterol desaturase family protein n=1 Tax=Amycolatopsis echigonensis TaxID=2576905 RepID=A0A8E1W3B6_9PSEU|nr:sterol desaturase family protein [Amycolatopsis echigonensis]MBB2502955.1 sterol desaturase family protein [Amycolatopsis echigonensis]
MTDHVERLAQERLSAAERDLARRPAVTLGATWRAFWRYPSPWMISAVLVGVLAGRLVVGQWALGDLWAPLVLVALYPFIEWTVHVFILHWRPRRIAGLYLDTRLARDHRRHHAEPRDVPLVFVPWRSLIWGILIVGCALPIGVGLLVGASPGEILSFMLAEAVTFGIYEWTHYLIHSDYRPKSRAYKAIWRNHRLHHYKNEHYWFSITTSGTSDRVLGTHPDPAKVPTSGTAKNLHGEVA